MKHTVQKRLAGDVLKCSPKRVHFVADRVADIKDAITKQDIRALVNQGLIFKEQEKGVSRVRARHRAGQRRKGLQRGPGKRKGKATALVPRKQAWMAKIRVQRSFLQELRTKGVIDQPGFKNLYRKSKGGFFRNKRHIKIYIEENDFVQKR